MRVNLGGATGSFQRRLLLLEGLTQSERDQLVVLMEKVVSELGDLSRSNS